MVCCDVFTCTDTAQWKCEMTPHGQFCWILGSGKLPLSVCINAYQKRCSFWYWIGKTTLQDNMLQETLEFVFSIEVPLALPLPDSAAASVARRDMPTKGLTTSEHNILGAALGNRTDGLYSFSLTNSTGNWCIACHPQHLGKSGQKGHNKPLAIAVHVWTNQVGKNPSR